MEWLQEMLDNSGTPVVTAILLGLLTAVSPCPLTANIAAMGYIGREAGDRRRMFRNGIYYILGRTLSYTVLGIALIIIINEGASIFGIQRAISKWGELLAGPLLMATGAFMLFGDKLNLHGLSINDSAAVKYVSHGSFGAFAIGVMFAMAFCPISGVLYFGMLIPISAATPHGYLLPALFAVATSLPVVAAAWILAFGVERIAGFYGKMQKVHKLMNIAAGAVFIIAGLYYCIETYL